MSSKLYVLENHLKETPCSPPKHVDLAGGTSLQEAFFTDTLSGSVRSQMWMLGTE